MEQNELIFLLLDKWKKEKPHNIHLHKYYEGKHKILYEKRKTDPTKSDMRAPFNYCRKTVQNFVGYLLGNPVNYTSRSGDKAFTDLINFYFSSWEKQHNINLKINSEIFGKAYEVSFINTNGEFQCMQFSPLEMAVMYDGSINERIKLAIRPYKLEFDDTEYLEVWDDNFYTLCKVQGSNLIQIEQKENRFSSCPVRKLKNNELEKSAFEDIIKIVDYYNAIYAANVGEILDHRNAYLAVENAKLTPEKAQEMKENGIMLLPAGGKSYWIVKDVNASFVKDMLANLKDEIYTQTNQIDLVDSPTSNTSGISLRLRLQELENTTAIKESFFESLLRDRLKFFCEWLKISQQKEFDYRDVVITFTRNIPVDVVGIATMVRDLQGIVPNEELLAQLPFITNPAASVQKLKEEQDSMGLNGLDDTLQSQSGVNNG